jgi:hypothetical protein
LGLVLHYLLTRCDACHIFIKRLGLELL